MRIRSGLRRCHRNRGPAPTRLDDPHSPPWSQRCSFHSRTLRSQGPRAPGNKVAGPGHPVHRARQVPHGREQSSFRRPSRGPFSRPGPNPDETPFPHHSPDPEIRETPAAPPPSAGTHLQQVHSDHVDEAQAQRHHPPHGRVRRRLVQPGLIDLQRQEVTRVRWALPPAQGTSGLPAPGCASPGGTVRTADPEGLAVPPTAGPALGQQRLIWERPSLPRRDPAREPRGAAPTPAMRSGHRRAPWQPRGTGKDS